MAGKDRAGLVDQDGVGPNPIDALHQPGDLILGMASRVSREGLQITDRDPSDLVLEPSRCARALGTTWGRRIWRRSRRLWCDMPAGAAAGKRGVATMVHAPDYRIAGGKAAFTKLLDAAPTGLAGQCSKN